MATIIEQQVAMDKALVLSTQRCSFFKAFLVTADVLEIYMQEFWATVYVHQHSIRFKINNKKHIVKLESFRDMMYISPRIPGQSFDELPFEEEILERKTSHSQLVDKKFNSFSAKSFSEEVRQLILCVDEVKFSHPILNFLFDEMDDDEGGGDDEKEGESDEEDDNEETREEESFDPIPKTPEGSKDEGDGEEDQGLNDNEEEHVEEEEEDELYRDQESSSVSSQFVTSMLNPTSDVGTFIRPSLTLMKPIRLFSTHGETVILKRRRDDDDDDDKDEGPSAGSDRGSKRRREGKEPESASAPLEIATRSAGRSTIRSNSRQASANESAFAEEPVQTTSQIEEPSHLVFETGAED
nr:hypothetical protein [Tanacetum cinerariifolium]